MPQVKFSCPKIFEVRPCLVGLRTVFPCTVLGTEETCVKDELFSNSYHFFGILLVVHEVCEDGGIIDLFDDVGNVLLGWVPWGSHAFIVFGDVVGGPFSPFPVDSVKEITEGSVREAVEHSLDQVLTCISR